MALEGRTLGVDLTVLALDAAGLLRVNCDRGKRELLSSTIGDTMIVNYSDTHKLLADMAAEAEPGVCKYVLIEAVSAVRHLCDQYGLNYEEVLAEAGELYRHQQERDLKDLETRE